MNYYKLLLLLCACAILAVESGAQERRKPFSVTVHGVTITGTYTYGKMRQFPSLGFFPNQQTNECQPGNSICVFDVVAYIRYNRTYTNKAGQKSLDITGADKNNYPVVVSKNGNELQFAIDLELIPAERRSSYQSGTWKLESPFILSPQSVRELGLYSGTEEMCFVIPAGTYPLYRDGNISYWTLKIPE